MAGELYMITNTPAIVTMIRRDFLWLKTISWEDLRDLQLETLYGALLYGRLPVVGGSKDHEIARSSI